MKKSIRLLLLGLLTPLFCGVSFASSCTNYVNQVISYPYTNFNSSVSSSAYYCVKSDSLKSVSFVYEWSDWENHNWFVSVWVDFCFIPFENNQLIINSIWSNLDYNTDFPFNFSVSSSCGLFSSSVENQYLTCSQDLSSCNSDLSSCQNNGSNCDTLVWVCQENLSGCMADKSSLQNYNEALTTQLNECLNNQWTWSNLTWIVLNNNSLFWYLDDSLLSLPINNNLFLPLGYQGALDSWNVLYIKSIDEEEPENYYITEEDKISIIDILSYVFVFFLWIGVIFSLIKLFKKIFTH